MNESEMIATRDMLLELGFEPVADPMPGLIFDFGNFKLRASELINLNFQEVMLFEGVLATPRTATDVEFEMRCQVKSREQCAAWIVWHLDQAAKKGVFIPVRKVNWLDEGRTHKDLLPWIIEHAENLARPHCFIQRDWARLALKTLAKYLVDVNDDTPVIITFKDSVLTIRCNSQVVALAGQGRNWPNQYKIPAQKIRHLPNRLKGAKIEVSICDGKLRIGDQVFEGIKGDLP